MELHNDKYQNKYRSASTRLQNWDYGWNAIYFVTICTKDRDHYFGEIINNEMHLSPVGAIADVLWYELKNHFDNIELDAFVVMPNHIHGIIVINNNGGTGDNGRDNACVVPTVATTKSCDEIPNKLPIDKPKTIGQQRFQHQGTNTLSSIVGSYKSAVSKHAHRLGYDFAWQSRFYDNIVRNNDALTKIQTYINNNRKNWKEDKFQQQ
ncbi:MAG: hypothetical protein IK025_09735 [Bacteroidales bacterium]|nr:hypothetical protein [Bacteroidales bacterium]